MKKILFLLLAFYSISLIAQKTIRGKVVTTKGLPLVGASVYINSTSIGTTTNDEGEFELVIKNGKYDLIASYIGFNTAQYSLDTETINQPIVFKLNPKSNMLDEVVVSNKKNKMSAEDRAYFLAQFKNTFLGKTNLSKQCRILNEGVIDLDYDIATRILEASVSEPIIIEHKGLGYKIYKALISQFGHLYSGKGRRHNTIQVPKIWGKLNSEPGILGVLTIRRLHHAVRAFGTTGDLVLEFTRVSITVLAPPE